MISSILMSPEVYDPQSGAIARGRRLETLRKMTGLTRKNFEKKYNVSASTIQSWEAAKAGGLTDRGAQRVIQIFRQEQISCTLDWLLYGIGNSPQQMGHHTSSVHEQAENTAQPVVEEKTITQELLVFRALHQKPIDLVVCDDGMEPYYKKGDYVAGKRRYQEEITYLVGKNCIVVTSNNEVLLRRIKKSVRNGFYDLICVNPNTNVYAPVIYEQQLICAAPVIWHRCFDRH